MLTALRLLALPACLAAIVVVVPAAQAAPILGAPVTTTTVDKPEGVVLADVNEDGFDDAIVGNRDQQAVQIFRGSAAGLGSSTLHEIGSNIPAWVTTGDMNGDSHVDVVVASVLGGLNGKIAVLLGDGSGAFAPATGSPFAMGTDGPLSQDALKVADITGDGNPDVVTGEDSSLVVLPGNGTGALGAPVVTSMMFTALKGIAIGDFIGDSRPDVLTSSPEPGNAELFHNVGGTLMFDQIITTAGDRIVAGNVDGVGRPDAIFSRIAGNNLRVALSSGDGSFNPLIQEEASMFFVAGMALGDLDADGINDLAVGGKDQVDVLRGNGLGAFDAFDAPIEAIGSPDEVAFGDVDGDGQTDLVFTNPVPDELTLARNLQTVTSTGPASVDFGRGSVPGGSFVERKVTLAAAGPGFYRTSGASVAGSSGVSIVADGCKGERLRVGSTCDIVLRLTPAATGEIGGNLIVTDNSEAGSRSIALTGFVAVPTGISPTPTPAPKPTPTPAPDKTRPVVSKLSLSPATFAVAKGATARRAGVKQGTRIRFTLSESARVTLTFERRTAGLRRGRRSCVKPTAKLRKARARKCVRYVRDGTIVRTSLPKGARAIAFTGRIGKKALKLGRHRVTISARDAAGNTTKTPPRKTFRVVRTPKKK
ncbi:MAG: VCBS repeat-containing protein [Solirubrobacterales bacterium]|nr:VCBS repeat-containing protein [Solirubrobacterales bacterium]MBA3605798.1 VCBS repeat-containing protein [Acidimicrobiia bacterium]